MVKPMPEVKEDRPYVRRSVPADLLEATPERGGAGQWLLASPILMFGAWLWMDLFAYISPIAWYWLDAAIGLVLYIGIVVLPLGYTAHLVVTALPRLFSHAGWDLAPREPVAAAEIYMVRYVYRERKRAPTTWRRAWLRAAQGWVYLEIAAIFAGALLMIPIFFSASQFGFGS
jgi:hypothetical protein